MTPLGRNCVIAMLVSIAVGAVLPMRASSQTATVEPGAYRLEPGDDRSGSRPEALGRGELATVLGREVRTLVEEDGGRIIDLLVDRDGRIQAAVIEFGGFLGIGTRKIAVDWSALRFGGDGKRSTVIVDLTRDQLRVAPEYKPGGPASIVRNVVD
jgi:hypothetical protein